MIRISSLTRAEAAGSALVLPLALLVVAAYSLDRLDTAFTPALMAVVGAGSAAGTLLAAWPRRDEGWETLDCLLLTVSVLFAWLLWLARPDFLPLGSGPDLTHHLTLIRFIEDGWRLPHDPQVEAYLGEMFFYTPGSHVLVALAGAWSRSSGLQAFQPVLSLLVALKLGFVFLTTRRLLSPAVPRTPIALLGALSLFASQTFLLGSFIQYAFLAQVAAELFVVVMWWALTVWHQEQNRGAMAIFAVSGAALFLTWPVLVGAPLLALGIVTCLPGERPFVRRCADALAGALPVVAYALLFVAGREGWLRLAATGGAITMPTIAAYGWIFLAASAFGLAVSATDTRARSAACIAVALLLEGGSLYAVAARSGNGPYMAFKLTYVFLCVQGALVALAVARVWPWRGRPGDWGALRRVHSSGIAWILVGVTIAAVARSVAGAPRSLDLEYHPAIFQPLVLAGTWAHDNLPKECIEYLVADDETAYWLHLAVLGNKRLSPRTADAATFDRDAALLRWLSPGGLPYAIADLPSLPSDVRRELDIVHQFGSAAVARRRGPSSCQVD